MYIDDLKEMIHLMDTRGPSFSEFEFHAPKNYADLLHAELAERGVDVPSPDVGDTMSLEFTNGRRVRVLVH